MGEWRNGGTMEWRNGGMAESRNGGMAKGRNGGTVELPWNENRRHSVAYLPRGMTRTPSLGRRWNDHQMKMTVIWMHIGLVD